MTLNTITTGLPRNNSLQFDATKYYIPPATIINSTSYSGGAAVRAYHLPQKTVIFNLDTPLEEGELSGLYVVRVFWTGSNLGSVELKLNIYEAENLAHTVGFAYGPESMNVGSSVAVVFDPRFTYRFTLEVGDLSSSNITIDYLQLDQIYHGGVLNDRILCYDKGDGLGTLVAAVPVQERGIVTVQGTGTRFASSTLNFRNTYLQNPTVMAVSPNADVACSVDNITTTGCRVMLNHVDGGGWSSTLGVWCLVVGDVASPFKPLTTVI